MAALYKINQRTTAHPSTVQYCDFLSQLNLMLQFLYLFAHEIPPPPVMVWIWHGPPEMHVCEAWFPASSVLRALSSTVFSGNDELMAEWATDRLNVFEGSGLWNVYLVPRIIFLLLRFCLPWTKEFLGSSHTSHSMTLNWHTPQRRELLGKCYSCWPMVPVFEYIHLSSL